MEQFRHIGEAIGSIRALMVFRDEIRINPRQCQLLCDAYEAAFVCVSNEMLQHLRIEEKQIKWKPLEEPLKDLHRSFREGEQYIRQCLDLNDCCGRSIFLSQSADCVELHLYNLICSIPVVLEAIESICESSGDGPEEIYRRLVFTKKYEKEWMDPKLFQHKFGKLYLISQEMRKRMDVVAKEDRWALLETLNDKPSTSKEDNRLADLLKVPRGKILHISILTNSQDYQVRRRLGTSGHIKEIQWMCESFALKHVFCDVEQMMSEISLLFSTTHPNVLHYLFCFSDDKKKECFMVMELMNKDLTSYIKEVFNQKRKGSFSLSNTVNVILQIARGMEYLHSKNIFHGDLKPSNILVKMKSTSCSDACVHVKIAGFGQSLEAKGTSSALAGADSCIWYAPEVLSDQDQQSEAWNAKKYTEKADVYSFGMICFELLTGKVPFEEGHLQGDKMSRNIKLGERPLFPSTSSKFLSNLTKKCWHADPIQRPTFSSICRVLRYMKRFTVLNPDNGQPEPPSSPLDYFDIEMILSKKFEVWRRRQVLRVYDIPFEMYAYRMIERERTSVNTKEKSLDSGSDASLSGEENKFSALISDDMSSLSLTSTSSCSIKSAGNASNDHKKTALRKFEIKPQTSKQIGNHNLKGKLEAQSPRLMLSGKGLRMKPENQFQPVKHAAMSPLRYPARRKRSGHASDSDL